MSTVALPPAPAAPVTPTAVTLPRRRPRLRRPGHEPEPVGATTAVAPPLPGMLTPIPVPDGPVEGERAGTARPGSARDAGPTAAGRDSSAAADADVRRRASATVRTMVEVLAGRRPPSHLAAVARPEVVRYVAASRVTGAGGPGAPARVHVSRPGRDVAEVVAVCPFGTRFRALAVRLDRAADGPGWCATAVRLL